MRNLPRGVNSSDFGNKEPVSALWDCLNVSGSFSVIVQRFPEFANGHAEAAVEIHEGILNPRGDMVGATSISKSFGYTLIDGVYTTFEASPNATFTNGLGNNPQGDVVGRYVFNGSHGYLLSDGQFTTIDVPGAVFTGNAAINARGDIVGRYRTPDGVFHGFLLSKHKETFD